MMEKITLRFYGTLGAISAGRIQNGSMTSDMMA